MGSPSSGSLCGTGLDQCHSAAHVFAAGPLRACRISVALMIDRADDGVGASRQGCHGNEHQRELAHVATVPKIMVTESDDRS
jgi:hypothetical protein